MRKIGIAGLLIALLGLPGGSIAQPSLAQSANPDVDEINASLWSLENARNEVQRGLTACDSVHPWTVHIFPDIVTFSFPGHFFVWELRELHDVVATYTDSNVWLSRGSTVKITVSGHFIDNGRKFPKHSLECSGASNWAQNFHDALLRLKQEYDKNNSAAEMERFKEVAARYQAADPKPELPEEARRFRVQAERAVADKRFIDAAERYGKAIEVAPWWPEAHFNRAVVLAELQSFDSATSEMNRYLMLKPDAPDARQARDFIYSWEDRPFKQN